MATKLLPRPRLLPPHNLSPTQRRAFLPNPFATANPLTSSTSTQTLSATRTFPYPHLPIYAIISDLESYPAFLPFCASSAVTKWSAPDAVYKRRWPSEGKMVVGYKGVSEEFTSRIFCVPGRTVESTGGQTETALDARDIRHHLEQGGERARSSGRGREEGGLLTHLRSRWTVEPLSQASTPQTQIKLELEFAFASPFYATLSAGATPLVAEKMIKAFEGRVRALLHDRDDLATATLADFGGNRPEH